MNWRIQHEDCIEHMRKMEDDSIDSIVCDPPYGLEFLGKSWDRLDVRQPDDDTFHKSGVGPYDRAKVRHSSSSSYGGSVGLEIQRWHEAWVREAHRALKQGDILYAFGGSRTWHRLYAAIVAAGFTIHEKGAWTYGSGFAKGRNVLKLDILPEIERQLREQGVTGDILWSSE